MRFTAKIENGKIHWHDRAGIKHFFEDCEGEYYIDIKPSNTRNTAQNNFYWALLRDWGRCIGHGQHEVEYLHGVIKSKFQISTTSDFDRQEFSEFLDDVIVYVCNNGYEGKNLRATKPE